ncbi:CAP domain-containing protein [Piscinibacter sp. XHJ-5]|uniref:CAP domain-containing protein n=1 Tax=Piscinibacter sp. XHJ-5 TaxID=3037797 RepID=UPI00245343EA|nr:CAP domain-containing protein [Piscinibacter sp. XHJ-5]
MSRIACLLLALPLSGLAEVTDHVDVARLVVAQTNEFRRSQGAGPTVANPRLEQAARSFAEFMARSDRYGHEADGKQPPERAKAHGYDYCMVSENIAYQFHSAGFRSPDLAQRLVRGWELSPGHRRNMLDPDVTETGVAVARSPKTGRYYAVQMFGRPNSSRIEFRIANRSASAVRYELAGEWFHLPPHMTRTHGQCRLETLTMRLPGDQDATRIQPNNGERYAVERVGARYRLTKG